MMRTKEAITLEMRAAMRRWVLIGLLCGVLSVTVVIAWSLFAPDLGWTNWIVTGFPYIAVAGCTVMNVLATLPTRRKYEGLKLERESAPCETVARVS